MSRLMHNLVLRTVKALDVLLLTAPFVVCWLLYYAERTGTPFGWWSNCAIWALFVFLYSVCGRIYGAFRVSLFRISEMIYNQSLAAVLADGVLYVVICLLAKRLPNIWPMLATLSAQLVLAVLWCRLTHIWYFKTFPAQASAIVYDSRQGMEELFSTYGLEKKFHVQFTINAYDCAADPTVLQDTQAVFLRDVHSHERNIILKYCVEQGISVYVIPRLGDIIMSGAERMQLFHMPMLRVGRYNPSPLYQLIKRVFDIIISGLALVVLSPLFGVTAAAIHLSDGGPVFYRQRRLTKDGKTFALVKFRSMRVDAEKDGVARLSTGDNDDRITQVGRVIRKVRLDELPQLLNILAGDMSLVGPRPERPEIAEQYQESMPEFKLRLQAKAGLTGYAQVYGKYNTTPYHKLQMDLMYIARPSLLEDLRIMLLTVKILFLPESTEGVQEGNVTAMDRDNGAERLESKAKTVG